ncbi:MAG TPA: hypothetical protein VKA60_05180 [Blastocatellia bacterium]|nr:hypothetical protein [Blastocatellia bacterium]
MTKRCAPARTDLPEHLTAAAPVIPIAAQRSGSLLAPLVDGRVE